MNPVISFMSANFVARELGYRMTDGWMQGDSATQDCFRPVATFAGRFDAMLGEIKALGFKSIVCHRPDGEDFGQFARTDEKIPGVIFWLGAVEPDKYAASQVDGMPLPSLHSPLFAPDYDPAIATGVDAMTAAVIDLFKD